MADMNVLMIGSSLGTGLMFNMTNLSLALKKRGLNISVITTSKEQGPGLKEKLKASGIIVYECESIDSRTPWGIYLGARELARIVKKDNIDVIHAQGIGQAIKACVARKLFRSKAGIVQSLHTYAHGRGLNGFLFLKIAPGIMNRSADIVSPVSERIGQNLLRAGLRPDKYVPVHNGIDLEQFDIETSNGGGNQIQSLVNNISEKLSIIYPAVLVPRKGHRYLIEAAAGVLKEEPDTVFLLTSSGPIRGELEKQVKELGIDGNVIFTGRLEYEDLFWLISKSHIGVFPSLAELLPMAVLDMMAASLPVVATDVDGIPEMVTDGKTGFLVSPRDSGTLAERILELIRNPEKARQMGMAGRKAVEERFTIDIIAGKIEGVYNMLLPDKSDSRT